MQYKDKTDRLTLFTQCPNWVYLRTGPKRKENLTILHGHWVGDLQNTTAT